jgi:uncharacterized protein (TIGR03000 family)
MRNRIILGVTALFAFALLAETAQAQWGRRGGGWGGWNGGGRSGTSIYVGTPYGSVGYSQGNYGGYYGGWGNNYGGYPGYYGYGYGSYYPRSYGLSYYPNYYSGYSYSPSYDYSYYPSSSYSDSGISQASFAPNANTVVLRVHVPDAMANVWIENSLMSLQGFDRTFVSPSLTSGKSYTYTVKASWSENGKEVTKVKSIDVQPGQEYDVSFNDNSSSQPGRLDQSTQPNQPSTFPAPRQSDSTTTSTDNSHEGIIVQASDGSLIMTDLQGSNRHTHVVNADAKIMRDGKDIKLEELREGDRVRVITQPNGTRNVTRIEVQAKPNTDNTKPQREPIP